ncbi:Ig-like domain-containing protein [Butyrivibrio sp. LC3010]|uniref:Ig-like domain-containing protein n=1 Tax=Butyrivibrio sp. LC3010 TaxID=1280680 RepID=UPI0003FF0AFF|nr:Ig-like domain-containing protein [Butyrivibrio sp. LC3010]
MRKVFWGKSILALSLAFAIMVENSAALTVNASEINDINVTEEITGNEDFGTADENNSAAEENNSTVDVITSSISDDSSSSDDNSSNTVGAVAESTDEAAGNNITTDQLENTSDGDLAVTDGNADKAESEEASENSESDQNAGISDTANDQEIQNPSDAENKTDEELAAESEVSDGNANAEESEAFDFVGIVDGYKIILHADAGVVPAGTEAVVRKVNKVAGVKTDELVNDVLPAESAVYESASFDISLFNNGVEIEPEGNVSVDIVLADELTDAKEDGDSTSLQVFHIEDDLTTTEVNADVTQNYGLNSANDNATDIYGDTEETVVHYDADSFSVYDVSVVLNFTTSDAIAELNPVYEGVIDANKEELDLLASGLDSTVNVKTLLASGGKCTSTQEMGEAVRRGIMARQSLITVDFKLPGIYNELTIVNELYDVMIEHTGVPNEGDYVRWAYCENSYQTTKAYANDMTYGTFQISFIYTHSAQQEIETTNAINSLVNKLKLTSLKSDYDKAKAAYDWICKNVTYDHDFQIKQSYGDYSPYSCYSAAIKHYTVCEGYSLLFYRMMLMSGVDARLIPGDGGRAGATGAHGWNIVKIGNIYYNVDSTWGSEFSDKSVWFLKGSKNFDTVSVSVNGRRITYLHSRYDPYNTNEFHRIYPTSVNDYNNVNYNSAPVSISINTPNAMVGVGQSIQLTATVSNNKGVIWSSSDSAVATVSDAGIVTGLKNGECEIFATSVYGGKKARCRVLVTDGRVKTVEVAANTISIFEGSKANANASVFPEWAVNKAIRYKSSNKKIASVNKNGVITAKKKGKCVITCTSADGGYQAQIKVVVKKATRVKSIKLTKKKIKLTVGAGATLGVKFNPRKATNKELTWKSSKPGIVSVDAAGNIIALSKGKAKITAKSVDGKHKATCTVVVK